MEKNKSLFEILTVLAAVSGVERPEFVYSWRLETDELDSTLCAYMKFFVVSVFVCFVEIG